jgi:hypothetical protein
VGLEPVDLSPRAALTAELAVVVHALWFEIDHGDGSAASSFFTPDAELRFVARSFHGTAEIDGVYAARTGRGPRVARHVATNLHVTEATDTTATAVSILVLYADDGEAPRPRVTPSMVGDVVDSFERHDDRWLIRRRHIQQQFVAPGATLAVPTEEES